MTDDSNAEPPQNNHVQGKHAVPFEVVERAYENQSETDNFAVCRSDGRYIYATTLKEAHSERRNIERELARTSPTPHSVAIIKLECP